MPPAVGSASSAGDGTRVGEVLKAGTVRLRESGSETARLDAEVLLAHVLHIDRASLLAHPEAPLGPRQLEAYERSLQRRAGGEPVAYIRGLKEFFSLAITVDSRALIPRPETERLVEIGLDIVRRSLTERPRPAGAPPLRAWDVGTGSGAIVVALAVEARRRGYSGDVRFLATDASRDALALAVENAVAHGVADMIEFTEADLLEHAAAPRVELITANLPYIPSAELPRLPAAASFEPAAALDGGPDGLAVIRRLLGQVPAALLAGGSCLVEFGADQSEAVRQTVAELLPRWRLDIAHDLAGLPRVAELTAPPTDESTTPAPAEPDRPERR